MTWSFWTCALPASTPNRDSKNVKESPVNSTEPCGPALVRQTFQVRQILRPPARRLVFPQTRQTDHRNHQLLDLNHLSFGVTRFELDSRNGGENFNSNRRHPHANDVIPDKKQVGGQPCCGEAKLAERPLNSGGVFRTNLDPNIEIVGRPDVAVDPDRVAADQQVFNV